MGRPSTLFALFVSASVAVGDPLLAQQIPDPAFNPEIAKPAFATGTGPLVLLDEAHHNFHTAKGRYQPFAGLLQRDGYVVEASKAPFSEASLARGRILVIANALHASDEEDWSPPNPSAFTDSEIAAVVAWVGKGGSLMLIVDHQPFPGAAGKLAAAFGVQFSNGYAIEPKRPRGPLLFDRQTGMLIDHAITRGRSAGERITSVVTFTGSAFRIDQGEPLLKLTDEAVALMPKAHERPVGPATPRTGIGGWLQGAVKHVGAGRIAVFGEAAMFTAQLAGPDRIPAGMNAPIAKENPQFLLNILHWLSHDLD